MFKIIQDSDIILISYFCFLLFISNLILLYKNYNDLNNNCKIQRLLSNLEDDDISEKNNGSDDKYQENNEVEDEVDGTNEEKVDEDDVDKDEAVKNEVDEENMDKMDEENEINKSKQNGKVLNKTNSGYVSNSSSDSEYNIVKKKGFSLWNYLES